MKRLIYVLFALGLAGSAHAQEVKITPKNFVDKNDETKNYVVIEVPRKSQKELYNNVLTFARKYYNNPKFVTTTTENEQIVIDALANEAVRTTITLSGSNLWDLEYKVIMSFKDGRIKLEPIYKFLNNGEGNNISLVGKKILGSAFGLFNDKGKPLKDKPLVIIDEFMNSYIQKIKEAANADSDNW